MPADGDRLRLRDLPLPTRLVLAAFLVSVAAGYAAALVQLHFQHAAPGQLLPGLAEVERTYHGSGPNVSQIARLLDTGDGPFNGSGTMRPAFFEKSRDWEQLTAKRTPDALQRLLDQRETERLALLHWVRDGAKKESYDADDYALPPELAALELTTEFVVTDKERGAPVTPRRVRIRSLITQRCVDCHGEKGRDEHARSFPLDSHERLLPYCQVKTSQAMSLPKLAQTTHVHLLGFALLYGLTGLIFSCTSYAPGVRLALAPLPLLLQVVEIGCWWLARWEPTITRVIFVTGMVVAGGLAIHVGGSLWDLFGKTGRVVLLLLLLGAGAAGLAAKVWVVDPYLERERIEQRRGS